MGCFSHCQVSSLWSYKRIRIMYTVLMYHFVWIPKYRHKVKRLCQRLNEIMVYAVNTGLVDNNPLEGINKAYQTPVKQHLPTLKPEQLPTLLKTLAFASIKTTTRCVIEWQLHTMVRPSEAAGACWDEIDSENSLWNIPAERMKSKKPHIVPLSISCPWLYQSPSL